jgi:hypothetical protein
VSKETGLWERLTTNKEMEEIQNARYEKFNPNGQKSGMLTGDEYFDYIGKFCGQPSRYGRKPIRKMCYIESQMASSGQNLAAKI